MPRRRRPEKRVLPPDPKYKSVLVTKFINNIMKRGKKSLAERILYSALDIVKERTKKDPLELLETAVNNVKPTLEVRSRRIGGANYQVPTEVNPRRQIALSIRWILTAARNRSEHSMAEKLASELIAASRKEGASFKKKEDTHRMAEANRAFAHFKW
ncbi:30S ribosomal protein S7 [bacterium]|nr:30S ribosomal protein S7 [bacterium]